MSDFEECDDDMDVADFTLEFVYFEDEITQHDPILNSPFKVINFASGLSIKIKNENVTKLKAQLESIVEEEESTAFTLEKPSCSNESGKLYDILLSPETVLSLDTKEFNKFMSSLDGDDFKTYEEVNDSDDDQNQKTDDEKDEDDCEDDNHKDSDDDKEESTETKSSKESETKETTSTASTSEGKSSKHPKTDEHVPEKNERPKESEGKKGKAVEKESNKSTEGQEKDSKKATSKRKSTNGESKSAHAKKARRSRKTTPVRKKSDENVQKKDTTNEEVKRDRARERQRKRRRSQTESQKQFEKSKAKQRMRNLRKQRRCAQKNSNKLYLAERKRLLRLMKKQGCTYNENSNIDILQHNFSCYEKSLQWHECEVCHKKVMLSNFKKVRCTSNCYLFSEENNMDPKPQPVELTGLTYIEKQLISRVHPVFSVYKVSKGQYKYKGQVINFPQNIQSVADRLPYLVGDLDNLVVVKLTSDIDLKEFYVRKNKVLEALYWLQKNNPLYKDVIIDHHRLSLLPDDGNVFDELRHVLSDDTNLNDDNTCDGSDNGHDLISSSGVPDLKDPSLNNTLNNSLIWPQIGKLPINEFGSPGYLTLAFPHLFPYAEADYTMPRKHKIPLPSYVQHLMQYKDERFAKDERFRYFIMNTQMRWNALNLGNLYVKKNDFFSKMTIVQLKEYLTTHKSLVKQIMYYGSRIRTTKTYWNSRCGELLDMVQQIGSPTVFFTLSAADYYWPNLFRLLGKNVNDISISERASLIADNPLVADTYFYLRSKFFIDHCFKPHFGVTDIWYRYEFQHRGSVHLHGLAWFEDAPKLKKVMTEEDRDVMLKYFDSIVSCDNPDLNISPSVQHPCEISMESVSDMKDDLAQLCNHVQRHTKCRKGFCLKRKNQKSEYTCKYNFPKDLQPHSQLEITDNVISDIIFKRNDPYLNKFNDWTLQTWRANIDFSPIFSETVVYRYIAKYASKSEVKSQTYNDIMTNILDKKCVESEHCKQAIRKLLLSTCADRDYCAQEVVHFLMGYHFHSKSRDFVTINLKNRDWVSISYGYGSNHLIDNYMLRDKSFEKWSIFEMARSYVVRYGEFVKRKRYAIVRYFPRMKREFNEVEYYKYMSEIFYPWRDISDVSIVDKEIQNHVDVSVNRYIETPNFEKLPDVNEDPTDNESQRLKDNEQILSEFNPNVRNSNLQSTLNDEYCWDKYSKKVTRDEIQLIDEYLKKDLEVGVVSRSCFEDLSSEQLHFLDFIKDSVRKISDIENWKPIFTVLQGMPGTGKSHLLKACVKFISDTIGSESVKVLAPTGVAAKNVEGQTLHSFLLLGKIGFNMRTLSGTELLNYRNKYSSIKYLFIDECSMVGLRMLSCIERRCREIMDNEVLFGGVNIILVGDFNQLLPVTDQPLYAEIDMLTQHNSLLERGKLIMEEVTHAMVLKQCHRFASKEYVNFLKKVSSGQCGENEVSYINSQCVGYIGSQNPRFRNSLSICSTNDAAYNINNDKLESVKSPVAVIKAQNNNNTAFRSTDDMADGLVNVLILKTNAKVMLKKNINIRRGLVNGAVGFVKYIIYEKGSKPPSIPLCILVEFEDVFLHDLDINLVPILPCSSMWYKNGITCSRYQLPLVLCWACTVHRAQGLTLKSMILHAGSSEFALGLLYVALSRVSDKENLCLVMALTLERLNSVTRSSRFEIRQKFLRKLNKMSKKFVSS